MWGLLKGKRYARANVTVQEVKGRGRSAFAAKHFNPGDFICDYGRVVRKKAKKDWGEERNASLGIGCYCLDATYNNEEYVFDAAASINDPGRYINHASRHCNLLLMSPVMIGEPPNAQLKIGFIAKREILVGEELFFDYGIKDPDIPWLKTDAKTIATTLPKISPQMQTTATKKPRPPAKRRKLDCPIRGCATTNVSKLADHIRTQHPKYTTKERHEWLHKARLNQPPKFVSISIHGVNKYCNVCCDIK